MLSYLLYNFFSKFEKKCIGELLETLGKSQGYEINRDGIRLKCGFQYGYGNLESHLN